MDNESLGAVHAMLDCPTVRDHHRSMSERFGRFTSLTVYDPQNRSSEHVQSLLEAQGFRVEIEDEQDTRPE